MISEFHENYMYSYKEAELVENAKDIIDELNENHNLYFVTARDAKLNRYNTKLVN